ncbi:glycosyl transferase, WecB/TagA/CpsF family [hydrothermal vent metagenome]|uniref:Glycosyl transferase, WecB/TagA/CpsF family n=1 Tax=hydrothermal vent metagenome TaxID=652676 RepID=A0A3B1BPX2_9ZZZZ
MKMGNSNLKKVSIFGGGVSICTYESAIDEIVRLAKACESAAVAASSVHQVMEGYHDRELQQKINQFNIVTPDGQPVRWAMNLLWDTALKDRVSGPDLTLKLCERAAKENLKIFLYGSTEPVVTAMRSNLLKQFSGLNIVGIQSPYFRELTEEEDRLDVERINNSGAHICFVGLGCPRQEKWAYAHLKKVNAVMVCVGAAFDFHAGMLARAPGWMQRYGLEWLFRLCQEPGRLWKRYLKYNSHFIYLLLKHVVKKKYIKS